KTLADRDAGLPPPCTGVEDLAGIARARRHASHRRVSRRVMPELLAGRGVEREHVALRRLHVVDAVCDDRVRFERAALIVLRRACAEVDLPRELERADVRGRDLRERRVAVAVEAANV